MGTFSAKQKKVKIEIQGDKELILALKSMDSEATRILSTAVKKGGSIALDDAKKNCPTDTGALKESLKLTEKKATPTVATVTVDYDKKIKYGTFVELGTKNNAPNPFMRNAVDDNIEKINTAITEEISKAVGRKM